MQSTAIRTLLLSRGALQCALPFAIPASGLHGLSHVPSGDKSQGAMPNASLPSVQAMLPPSRRGFASQSQGEVATTDGENSWSKWRAPYGFEQKSSLGPAMYLAIATFGFSMYLNDMIYHPPRVVTLMGLMMLLLYVRRR